MLRTLGLVLHLQPDTVEQPEDVQPWLTHLVGQRHREGPVGAAAVSGDVAGLRGERDQRAFRRAHLRQPAGNPPRAETAKRIVAAGVEDDDVEPRAGAVHLLQHKVGIDHLKVDVLHARGIGIDRQQPVLSLHLHAVPGVIEQRHVGTLDLPAEVLHELLEMGLVEVGLGAAADHRKAETSQRVCDQLCVIAGIGEPLDMPISGVADHQRDAVLILLRPDTCRAARNQQADDKQEPGGMPAKPAQTGRPGERCPLAIRTKPADGEAQ